MFEIRNMIPGPDVVLALEPEELAATLLVLGRARGEVETFSVHNVVGGIRSKDRSRGISGYLRKLLAESGACRL